MTQIRYLGERKWSFVSATAETYRTNEFCHVTQRLQPRETWVRKPDFSSCLCYCPAVWSWVSHLTIPGNKVLLWWLLLGNSLHIGKNVEEPGDICSWVPNQGENNSMLLQGLHGRWVVKKEWGRNQCFDSYQGVKKELTKWGPPPHTHTHWEHKTFWASNMLHKQDMPHHRVPQEMTCLSCFKGQIFDHISNPTHTGTMNQGFRSCESGFNFPKFPKHAVAYFFFFIWAPRLFSIFNWLQKLELMICLSGHVILRTVWPPFSLHIWKAFSAAV